MQTRHTICISINQHTRAHLFSHSLDRSIYIFARPLGMLISELRADASAALRARFLCKRNLCRNSFALRSSSNVSNKLASRTNFAGAARWSSILAVVERNCGIILPLNGARGFIIGQTDRRFQPQVIVCFSSSEYSTSFPPVTSQASERRENLSNWRSNCRTLSSSSRVGALT